MSKYDKPVASHPWRHGYSVPKFTPMTQKAKYDMGIKDARPVRWWARGGFICWGPTLWYLFPELVSAKDIEESL